MTMCPRQRFRVPAATPAWTRQTTRRVTPDPIGSVVVLDRRRTAPPECLGRDGTIATIVSDVSPSDEFKRRLAETKSHAPDFVGLDELAARALAGRLGVALRVTTPDWPNVRSDLRAQRITVFIEGGVVVEASAG
jgi:hypothetical protein